MELYAISRRGGYLEYKAQYLSKLPLKNISENNQQPFIDKAEQMLTLNADLQTLSQKFQRMLSREFGIEKPSKKLSAWHELDDKTFFTELEKDRKTACKANGADYKKLTLGDKADWEDYFIAERTKAEALTAKIAQTDSEIDAMVYALYGLTDEEIAIVESA